MTTKMTIEQAKEQLKLHEPKEQYRGGTYGYHMTCYKCDEIAPCRASIKLQDIIDGWE